MQTSDLQIFLLLLTRRDDTEVFLLGPKRPEGCGEIYTMGDGGIQAQMRTCEACKAVAIHVHCFLWLLNRNCYARHQSYYTLKAKSDLEAGGGSRENLRWAQSHMSTSIWRHLNPSSTYADDSLLASPVNIDHLHFNLIPHTTDEPTNPEDVTF